jgi:ABC-type branched-subunit amino acid transport system ATPase component/branched-subunit amino acid ABC-type transport system permease component
MQEFIRFLLLGFGVGALYAISSQGLIVIYRGSGVLNFALGAIGMVGVYVEWELHNNHGWPYAPALIIGVLISAGIGALTHILIMRPLRGVSPIVRVIATLGVLITLQAIAVLRYGAIPQFVPSVLPTNVWHISGDIVISADRVILLAIAAVLSLVLWAVYKYTKFGLGTAAVAENERAASSLGWSPDNIAIANWALGCGLAGLAAILIAPIVTLQPAVMTNLILAATAAALVAGFRSFPIAFAAGLVIGIAQTEVNRYATQPGLGQSVPFLFIVIWLVLRGQALPLRDYLLQRLPSIGSGKVRWGPLAVAFAVGAFLMAVTTPVWIAAFTVTLAVGLILLSIVVLTGYTGQLSLAQYAIAGFGAWVAGRLAATQGVPFWLSLIIGIAAAVPLGVLFAIPAVRTRGINLAILTLGLGTAVELMLFDNTNYTGGAGGTIINSERLFGWDVTATTHPTRYGLVVLVLFVVCALAVANVRRGRAGRRMIAVRTNERAAASLGISVSGAKLYAFGLSAGIAAVGGILLAFQSTAIDYSQFTNFTSITDVGLAVIGGIGYLVGPIVGAALATGGFWSQVFNELGTGIAKYITLISGVSLILLILANQDGIVKETIGQMQLVRGLLARRIPRLRPREPAPPELPEAGMHPVAPRTLEARGVTVRYGGTVAVDDVSLTVKPGHIVGLIGPNGAGKTSFIDAVTGFTRMSGTLLLDGEDVSGWSAVRRARAGLGRSFQSLELFEDSTVIDNLRAASDERDFVSYLRDVVYPVLPPIPAEVVSAIHEFRLEDDLDRVVQDLPYGKRRLLAIARAVATHPSVLLLDEPAAGLGDVETAELAHLVRRLAADWGMAILLVEHDMNFVMSVCDELVVLDFGHMISEGAPEVVRKDEAVIAAYLGDEVEHHAPASGEPPVAADAEQPVPTTEAGGQ